MLTITDMNGFIDFGGQRPFNFNAEEGTLTIGNMGTPEAMDFLNALTGAQEVAAPIGTRIAAPVTVEPEAATPDAHKPEPAEVEAKPAKKPRATRKPRAKKPAKKTAGELYDESAARVAAAEAAEASVTPATPEPPVVAAIDVTADIDEPAPPSSVSGGNGSAVAPIEAAPEPDEAAEEPAEAGPAVEVVDLTQEADAPIPEGWAKDAKGQLYCESCGDIECTCDPEDYVEPEEPAEKQQASNLEAAEVDSDDPIFAQCVKETRLLNLVDTMIKNGIDDADAIYAKCTEWRRDIPVLAKITESTFDSRLRRVIGSTIP